jgi:CPA2 family monovalent cation:H+ antiporter-2
VGLEFSLPQLLAMRKEVLGLGGAQVVLTTAIVTLIAYLLGADLSTAFIIGGILALSSTAIVIKQLTEQLELSSRHGRLSVGILLFQDLAVVPFLIVIPALGGNGENHLGLELLFSFLKGALVLGVMLAFGHWLLRPLFHHLAKLRSAELFTLSVLMFSIAAAWLTDVSGLSLALGAFLAGMMLGETEFRHQVEADIRPFRDVLLGLFFITIGMLLDIKMLPEIFHLVALVVVGLISLKLILIFFLSRIVGAEKGVAFRTGIALAQGGEFGFALLSLAFSAGLMPESYSQVILASIVISMAITPTMIRYNGVIAKKLFAESYMVARDQIEQDIKTTAKDLNNHVIICGYGRIGQNIARFLERENIQHLALDLDPVRVREAKEAGELVYYGDSTHGEILEAAGLMNARVLVISYDEFNAAMKVLSLAKQLRPDLPVLVRTRDDSHLDQLQEAGATEIVPETLEASLMLSSHLMLLLDVPMRRIVGHIQQARSDRYQILRQFFHGQEISDLDDPSFIREGLHSLTLPKGAFAVGKTLQELDLEAHNISVTAIRRDDKIGPTPTPNVELLEGDVVVVYGAPEDLEHADNILLSGLE